MPARTHGQSQTSLYRVWSHMLGRCLNPNDRSYKYYGGRGITVCDRWRKFEAFAGDIGPRPSPKHSLEREDNNGDYSPSNCKWATMQEQSRNKRNNVRLTHDGLSATMQEHATRIGVTSGTLHVRLKTWSVEDALSRPKLAPDTNAARLTYKGKSLTISQWAKYLNLNVETLRSRLKKCRGGWSVERALTEPVK